ncbi:F0F1 ATP synthase subunit C [Candidatus Liberibacter solanacearum]|uniref:ATP synthase subunit c n=2 Tax=Candidatus Liberibacter solanacearum TaxID=556287 RepID=A0A0F4VPH7_9HYPH|nr:F0F1 ATP synthase subunit C [Candidatus Liberibacter solanacearum]ADR52434.1 H+transporting two-sector ATPase C subunit [Candidatus Liberibacter solanacearum CLso-ZC1]KJZ82582.1 ATP synthase C chain [Candidatus Liberibacter solanacearum]KQC49085.1 ATPase [Candidatus Liberibacter solanacearum]ONI60297.1 ATPase [Candidatus Liberibacter solanacearum]
METEAARIAISYYSGAAKYIAIGMACLGMGFVALAIGNIFSSYLSGALRNPSAAADQQARVLVFAAVAESLGIFLLLIVILLLFVI